LPLDPDLDIKTVVYQNICRAPIMYVTRFGQKPQSVKQQKPRN
jgi:hypothetical protein